jgi:hypothetical protein
MPGRLLEGMGELQNAPVVGGAPDYLKTDRQSLGG